MPRKKYAGGKIIATILGLFLLVGGLGAGVYLTSQNQNVNEQAKSSDYANKCAGVVCKSNEKCVGDGNCVWVGNPDTGENIPGYVCTSSNCPGPAFYCQSSNNCLDAPGWSGGVPITGTGSGGNGTGGGGGGTSGACSASGGNGQCAAGYSCSCPEWTYDWTNGTAPANDCTCTQVPAGQDPCGHTICPTGYKCNNSKPDAGDWYCELSSTQTGGGGGTASNPPEFTPTTPPVTVTPSPAPITASCQNIKAYSTNNWSLIPAASLSSLKSGQDSVYFCVAGTLTGGSFDKARFTINGSLQSETTTVRPNSADLCQLYNLPAGVANYNVTAEIHHVTLGWK